MNSKEVESAIKFFECVAKETIVESTRKHCEVAIEALNKQYKTEEHNDNNGWIPCSSGNLPKDYEDVLVWFEYFRYGEYNRLFQTKGISYMYDGKWSRVVNGSSGWHQLKIIAWQPLPPDYKPSEKGSEKGSDISK